MPPKSKSFAAKATNGGAVAPEPSSTDEVVGPVEAEAPKKVVQRPAPEVYVELREELAAMRAAFKKRARLLSEAIFPGPHDEERRKDMRDWIKWIADEQVGGVEVWLTATEVSGEDSENPLTDALRASEERVEELQAAVDALANAGTPVKVKGSGGKVKPDADSEDAGDTADPETDTLEDMGEHDKGSAGKVKADSDRPAIDYDDVDDGDEEKVEEPKAAPKPAAKPKAPAKKGTGKPGA